jgi:hypothetical protein
MYFQNNGLWYRETGGTGATIDILAGNNPHVGFYDGGFKYINQFKTLIPNFSPVTITVDEPLISEKNIFSNYSKGVITNYNGPTYVDVISEDNSDIGNCIVYESEIIKDPMPEPTLTPCGCECEGGDDILSVCVKKGKQISQSCNDLGVNRYIDNETGFWVVTKQIYGPNKEVIGEKETIFISQECCSVLGGVSTYMESMSSNGLNTGEFVKSSGYVCGTTQKLGCNVAKQWSLKKATLINGTYEYNLLQPIEIPIGSGELFLQFAQLFGIGSSVVVTPDGSNCLSNFTIPVSGIVDPYTGKIGFGCKLTDTGKNDYNRGEEGIIFKNIVGRQIGTIGACNTFDYFYSRH